MKQKTNSKIFSEENLEQHSLFLDTCVWLDIAKKPEPILPIITQLIRNNSIKIITSKIIIDEFERNKDRIAETSRQRLKQQFRDVKNVIKLFDKKYDINKIEKMFNDINSQIPNVAGKAFSAINEISDLLKRSLCIELSDSQMSIVCKRALDKKAPFHHNKNSIADALLVEQFHQYAVESPNKINYFVTHNTDDFSDSQDNRKVHPDYNIYFEHDNVKYEINIMNIINQIDDTLITDYEYSETGENRSIMEIIDAESEFFDKIWYDRHQLLKEKIREGKEQVRDDIWKNAEFAARKIEKKYKNQVGPYTEFDWGMLNGKLSALRWVLGEDWDMLDT